MDFELIRTFLDYLEKKEIVQKELATHALLRLKHSFIIWDVRFVQCLDTS